MNEIAIQSQLSSIELIKPANPLSGEQVLKTRRLKNSASNFKLN